jgi:hypothetical protein
MNSLVSSKFAGRVLMSLAAISAIIFSVACGSNSSAPSNPVGFSNSSLNGTYVVSMSGTDVNLNAQTISFFAIVGAITADGNGNITGGTVDINDLNLGGTGVFTGQAVSASSYSVGQDGRGTGRLVTPQGTFGLDFVLSSTNHGLITRFDGSGSGSGTIDIQGTATQTSLQSLAFSLAGEDSGGAPLGTVGGLTLDSSGTITPGTAFQDFNDSTSSAGITDLPLTGSVVLDSSGTTGTAVFTATNVFGSLTFDAWVVDSTHLKLIETDTSSGLAVSGDAFTQQASFTPGQLVFAMSGIDLLLDPVVAGGYTTTDANGTLSLGLEDYNNAGSTNTLNFTGTCTTFAHGRCQLATTGFTNGAAGNLAFAAYPSSGGVLLLQDDSNGLAQGAAYAQSGSPAISATGLYALNLSGANDLNPTFSGWAEVDDIAQFNTTSAASPAINMTGLLDENALAFNGFSGVGMSGTYAPDSTPGSGRGTITVPTINTLNGTLNLAYYVVNGSTVLIIDGDTDQVAMGSFVMQSAPSDQALIHPVVSMSKAGAKFHALKRHKK